ncbi:tetratricopeptide repeat protein [Mycoplasmatota bacterium zrk1]
MMEELRVKAQSGDKIAQEELGKCYYYGEGVGKSYGLAVKWYRKAAEQGMKYSQYALGYCYSKGQGVKESIEEAIYWYQKAGNNGEVNAQRELGDIYYHGDGVEESYEEAVKWFNKAAHNGDDYSQFILGDCYSNGFGVEKSYDEAIKWFKLSAENQNSDAIEMLTEIYESGGDSQITDLELFLLKKKELESSSYYTDHFPQNKVVYMSTKLNRLDKIVKMVMKRFKNSEVYDSDFMKWINSQKVYIEITLKYKYEVDYKGVATYRREVEDIHSYTSTKYETKDVIDDNGDIIGSVEVPYNEVDYETTWGTEDYTEALEDTGNTSWIKHRLDTFRTYEDFYDFFDYKNLIILFDDFPSEFDIRDDLKAHAVTLKLNFLDIEYYVIPSTKLYFTYNNKKYTTEIDLEEIEDIHPNGPLSVEINEMKNITNYRINKQGRKSKLINILYLVSILLVMMITVANYHILSTNSQDSYIIVIYIIILLIQYRIFKFVKWLSPSTISDSDLIIRSKKEREKLLKEATRKNTRLIFWKTFLMLVSYSIVFYLAVLLFTTYNN